ncbi:MAG: enoyl-CoA hydratase/isomerase family protein [Candidatus Omnitrophica bacterium]|nr:enoyl-CoA hydratase/isomerase family protein [Candidatus Omnitrophota bacterium]
MPSSLKELDDSQINPYLSYALTDSGIAVITLDSQDAKVNVLSSPFMHALDTVVQALAADTAVSGAVFRSAKHNNFIAGANIEELAAVDNVDDAYILARKGQSVFQQIDDLPFPVAAAVNGTCMGGGTELILACDYRLAASGGAKISLPEIKLGIYPAWGGSQRLPRLISLQAALDMILTGKTLDAGRALKTGLVDEVIPDELLAKYSIVFVEEIIRKGGAKYKRARAKNRGGLKNVLLEKNKFGREFLFKQARKNVLKSTGGNYPAPLVALEVVQRGIEGTLEDGLEIEASALGRLLTTPEHKSLVHAFYLSNRPKKQTGVDADVGLLPVESAAVVGAGVMGGGIAQLLAAKGYPVRMKDIAESCVAEGLRHAESVFNEGVKRRRIKPLEREMGMDRITGTITYTGFSQRDIVIEAVVENMEIKKAVLAEIEDYVSEDALLASNTSALSLTEMQSVLKVPERLGGMHFFNPVHRMPLVEVVRGNQTSDETVATLFDLSKKLGKTPIVVKDSPGFLVNRLLGVYLNEACVLAEEGFDFEWIDRIVKSFGMPMGPFRLNDEVGIDVSVEVAKTLAGAFGGYLEASGLLPKILGGGLLGKKSGRGFYLYKGGRSAGANTSVRQFAPGIKQVNEDEAIARMMYLMINEAARCLEEGVVQGPHEVDIGMIFGTGFPPFRGGVCKWADGIGLRRVEERLHQFEARFGKRFAPAGYLTARKSFYND